MRALSASARASSRSRRARRWSPRCSSADIFSCNSGPFNTSGVEMGALTARISAAINRTTLLIEAIAGVLC
ncbi:beta-1,3-glucanase family protein, partial [Catenulispora rubra]|uniref:beta-1,3-glucanase family protein n=1 Tax=Catenulispora rubra TaxID=280293 RepID=UPI002B27A5C2